MFLLRALLLACVMSCYISPALADHPSLSFGTEAAGPIITIPAATMPENTFALGITSEFIKSDSFSDSELERLADEHVHAHSTDWTLVNSLNVSYGLINDLTLNLRIPYIHRENIRTGEHSHGNGGDINSAEDLGDSSGLGDITALGKYRFWNSEITHAALLLGAKFPTGKTDVTHEGEKLEAEHQPGSGSWDGIFGFAISRVAGPVSIDSNVLYFAVTEGARDTDLGDRFQYNLAVSYRIGGGIHEHSDFTHHHRALDFVLELNGEWTDQQEIDGEEDNDSGGNEIFLSPGIRYVPTENWSAQLSVGIPAISDLREGHTDSDYKIFAGIVRSF